MSSEVPVVLLSWAAEGPYRPVWSSAILAELEVGQAHASMPSRSPRDGPPGLGRLGIRGNQRGDQNRDTGRVLRGGHLLTTLLLQHVQSALKLVIGEALRREQRPAE